MLPKTPDWMWPETHLRYFNAGCPTYKAYILKEFGAGEFTFRESLDFLLVDDHPMAIQWYESAAMMVGWKGRHLVVDAINLHTEGEHNLETAPSRGTNIYTSNTNDHRREA